ncbi:MAG: hypothetical protein KDM64_17100, partial [Verrucomicrobiae bacterium]|nr:hypothetical protein [Verrucomicrobiae bacterium]
PDADGESVRGLWTQLVREAFGWRWRGAWSKAVLLPEAFEVLERFRVGLGGRSNEAPDLGVDPRNEDWLSDLVIRVANVFALFRQAPAAREDGGAAVSRLDLVAAIRWMEAKVIAPHRELRERLVSGVSVRTVSDRLRLTDMERRVYHRIVERPGVTRRELLRSLHGVRSEDRDSALTELFRRGLVEADEEGRCFAVREGDEWRRGTMSTNAERGDRASLQSTASAAISADRDNAH